MWFCWTYIVFEIYWHYFVAYASLETYWHYFCFHFVLSEGCEEINYSMSYSWFAKDAEGVKEDGLTIVDLDELYKRNVRCAKDNGSMKKYMEIWDISPYVDVLADNIDFLSMSSQNEYVHTEFNAQIGIKNLVF